MKSTRLIMLLAAAALSLGAGKPAPAPQKANWTATVVRTVGDSHRIGNPAAKVKLVEYVSYTCTHCAEFEVEANGELTLGFLKTGTGSIEYRPFFRNIVDVTATLMAYCGPPAKFVGNHAALLRSQKTWMGDVSEAQQRRWSNGDWPTRMRAVATDMKLYDLFLKRGYDRPNLDRCLANQPLAKKLSEENQTASSVMGINGTPSFLINDRLQEVHHWDGLRPLLMAATR